MKTMMKIAMSVLLLAVCAGLTGAQTMVVPPAPSIGPNGLSYGRAFLAAGDFFSLHLGFNFTAVLIDGTESKVRGEYYLMLADGSIPYFASGPDVPSAPISVLVDWSDEPRKGFPFFSAQQVKNFDTWVIEAEGKANRSIYGSYYTDYIVRTKPIEIELLPGWRQWIQGYAAGDNTNVAIRLKGGADWYYDPTLGGFDMWVDPTRPNDYEIYDRTTGQVLQRGTINYGQKEQQENSSVVNVTYAGGVQVLQFLANSWINLPQENLLKSTNEQGERANVYVIFTGGHGVNITCRNLNGRIRIGKYIDKGQNLFDIPFMDTQVLTGSDYGTWISPVDTDRIEIVIDQTGGGYDLYLNQSDIAPPVGGAKG